MKVNSILSTKRSEVFTITPRQTIAEALSLLVRHNIGALPVVSAEGRLQGILSERDIIRRAAAGTEALPGMRVEELMTRQVIFGLPEDDIMAVAHTMTEKRFRHLPIVDQEKRLIGIISIGDVLKAQRDHYRGEIDTLETQLLAD